MAENLTGILLPWNEMVPRVQIPGKEDGPPDSRSAGLMGFALDFFDGVGPGAAFDEIGLELLRFFFDDGEECPSSSQELEVVILFRTSVIITVHGKGQEAVA